MAEKFEAMVVLGDRNSRIKDFFDLYQLANEWKFDRELLVEAVRRTFARRRTPVPQVQPIALTTTYWENPTRPAQVRAFANRAGLRVPRLPESLLPALLNSFLGPVLDDLRHGREQKGTWTPGGPWS